MAVTSSRSIEQRLRENIVRARRITEDIQRQRSIQSGAEPDPVRSVGPLQESTRFSGRTPER